MKSIDIKTPITKSLKVIGIIGSLIGFILGCNQFYNFYKEKTAPNLNGKWELHYIIEKARIKKYENLEIIYEVKINQSKDGTIEGRGKKVRETGKIYDYKEQIKIEIEGVNNGLPFHLNISEHGDRKESDCDIEFNKKKDNKFYGKFDWTASDAQGIATLIRINE